MSSMRKFSGFFSPANRTCTVCAALKRNALSTVGRAGFGFFAALVFAALIYDRGANRSSTLSHLS